MARFFRRHGSGRNSRVQQQNEESGSDDLQGALKNSQCSSGYFVTTPYAGPPPA